jgi:hypothetical protein
MSKKGEYTVTLPIFLETGVRKKRKHYLNLNLYRNMPFHQNNSLKKELKRHVLPSLPKAEEEYYENFELHYVLYLPNQLKRDISNVLSIVDKFFADALVENGNVPDDNYEHLKYVTYRYGGYDDKKNGYVEVTIKEVK